VRERVRGERREREELKPLTEYTEREREKERDTERERERERAKERERESERERERLLISEKQQREVGTQEGHKTFKKRTRK